MRTGKPDKGRTKFGDIRHVIMCRADKGLDRWKEIKCRADRLRTRLDGEAGGPLQGTVPAGQVLRDLILGETVAVLKAEDEAQSRKVLEEGEHRGDPDRLGLRSEARREEGAGRGRLVEMVSFREGIVEEEECGGSVRGWSRSRRGGWRGGRSDKGSGWEGYWRIGGGGRQIVSIDDGIIVVVEKGLEGSGVDRGRLI